MIRLPVNAVGRTAGAVGDLADSGVVVGMSRGRAWIFVVGTLLCGIVAVNVLGLSLSASSSETAAKIDALHRENSVLNGRIANRLSNDKVSAVASRLGLAVPAAGDVNYLDADRRNIAEAARRLASGEIAVAAPAVPESVDAVTAEVDPVTGESVVTETTDPAATETSTATAPVDPATVTEAATVPPPAVDPAAQGGGLEPGTTVP